MKIKEELAKLKDIDVYSLMLFAMFKLRDIPEYASLSEMVYILDKDSLLKLCEYFGGLTIKIPTIEELESIRNKKFIIVTVYQTGIVAEKENEPSEIIVCNLNDLLFVKESDLNKISINTKGRKKIRVDGTIYVETIEEEVYKLKELTHSNITIKDIVKKENTSGKRI